MTLSFSDLETASLKLAETLSKLSTREESLFLVKLALLTFNQLHSAQQIQALMTIAQDGLDESKGFSMPTRSESIS